MRDHVKSLGREYPFRNHVGIRGEVKNIKGPPYPKFK